MSNINLPLQTEASVGLAEWSASDVEAGSAGAGITIATQETFRPYIESGKLVSLLDDFLPQFPGFYLYFPQRRNIAPKLRALIDHVKEWRQQLA